LDKLPIGGKDFYDRDCTIELIEKSDHTRFVPLYRCELDCEEPIEYNLCDFIVVLLTLKIKHPDLNIIFFEKALSISKKKNDYRFLDYVKTLEEVSPLILREGEPCKEENQKQNDFKILNKNVEPFDYL
jgi:hypothetical protein